MKYQDITGGRLVLLRRPTEVNALTPVLIRGLRCSRVAKIPNAIRKMKMYGCFEWKF